MPTLTVRAAAPGDADAINRIYNHYIRNTVITFDLEPWSAERRTAWLGEFNGDDGGTNGDSDGDSDGGSGGGNGGGIPYYALVAELDDRVAGFACNHPFRPKAAYQLSTETTVYTDPETQSRGIGAALYQTLFARIAQTPLHRAYAAIALPNPRSIEFHQRFGFTQIGTLHQVGHKFGRYVDVAWFEKTLK